MGELAPLGRLETTERPPQQGQHVDELLSAAARPARRRASRAAAGRGPAAALRRRGSPRSRRPSPPASSRPRARAAAARPCPRRRTTCASAQQPDEPAGQQPVEITAPRRPFAGCRATRSRRSSPTAAPSRRAPPRRGPRRVSRRLVAQPGHGGRQRRRRSAPAGDGRHLAESRRVGRPHVAVAQRADQRGQRLHEVLDVGVERGPVARARCRTRGSARARSASRQASMARVTVASELSVDVARSTTRAVAAARTDVPQTLATAMSTDSSGCQASDHASLNVPGAASSAPACPSRCRAPGAGAAAGIERGRWACGGRARVPCRAGPSLSRSRRAVAPEVGLQRDGRRLVGDGAEALADDDVAGHQLEQQLLALTQHRPGRVGDLGQPGEGPAPHRREGLGEPDRLDDVGRRHRQVLLPQPPGDLGQPARRRRGRAW